NVDHLPIYVARHRGFFADQGLEIEIISPSDTSDALKLAASGQVDLAVSYEPQIIIGAARGLDIVVVGRLIEHPLTTLLFLKSRGIKIPRDLEGRKIGYTVPGLMDVLLDAFARLSIEEVTSITGGDDNVDREYASIIRQLITRMMEDPRNITRTLDVLWTARSLERIGDHSVNICEYLIYMVKGLDVRHITQEELEKKVKG
ncbi:MAG: ABC transporter substrate-binding protein, partial [Gammaproteobacteria bacterium]